MPLQEAVRRYVTESRQELLELTRVCRLRLDALYPPAPQLRPGKAAVSRADEDGAFLI